MGNKEDFKFYAFLNRMRFINRWSLMRNSHVENIAEHSHQVSLIAHALALIEKHVFLNKEINPEKAAVIAIYHDTAEVLTGDLPTPVKYSNTDMSKVYKALESDAEKKLLNQLPKELKDALKEYVIEEDATEYKLVKYADKISALIKCIEEEKSGNCEFKGAKITIEKKLKEDCNRSVEYFLDNFIKAFYYNLDELGQKI